MVQSDWELQNPGDLSDILGTKAELPQVVRKPTRPEPVMAPKRKQVLLDMMKSSMVPQKVQRVSHIVTHVSDSAGYESENLLPSKLKGTSTPVTSSDTSKVDNVAPTQLRPVSPIVTVESMVVQAVSTLSGKTCE